MEECKESYRDYLLERLNSDITDDKRGELEGMKLLRDYYGY